jgi:hypothetical protein
MRSCISILLHEILEDGILLSRCEDGDGVQTGPETGAKVHGMTHVVDCRIVW